MESKHATTLDGSTVEQFVTSLRGTLIRPGDDGYESARRVYNGTSIKPEMCPGWESQKGASG
jgi:hypothetical protein